MDYIGLGCCALAFVLYLNTLDAGFVYDDRRAILNNPDVLGSTPLKQLLYNDFWGTHLSDSGSHGSYRPLCVLSYKLNHLAGGFRPMGYHLVNVLLHCLATGLVVKLARQLIPTLWGAAVAGALFASHPIHTETVAGVVGRADLAACNFYLLTFLTYSKHVTWREQYDWRNWPALAGAILLSGAAVLCKETAITALLVCAIYDGIKALGGCWDKNRIRSVSIVGIALATILQLRLLLPGPITDFSTADNPVAKSSSMWTRLLTFTHLPVINFKLLLYPCVLSFDWGMEAIPRITSIFDVRNIISLVFYSSLAKVILSNIYILKNRLIPIVFVQRRAARSSKRKHHSHHHHYHHPHHLPQPPPPQPLHQTHLQCQPSQHLHHNIHLNEQSSTNKTTSATTITTDLLAQYHHQQDRNGGNYIIGGSGGGDGCRTMVIENINNNSICMSVEHQQQQTEDGLAGIQLKDDQCVCNICKQGLQLRHSSSCRAINNNNIPLPSVKCGCPPYRNSSPSPTPSSASSTSSESLSSTVSTASSSSTSTSASTSMSSSSSSSSSSSKTSSSLSIPSKHPKPLRSSVKSKDSNNNSSTSRTTTITTTNHPSTRCCKPSKITPSDGDGSGGGGGSGGSGYYKTIPPPPTSAAILFSVALLALPFLPAANVFFYVGFVVAERILYLPSVGYCLLIGLGVGKLIDPKHGWLRSHRRRTIILMCVTVMLISCSWKTMNRNLDWRDEESLYRSAIQVNPPKALGNLGSVLSSQGRFTEAKSALLMALNYRPNMADVHYNLGILYQNHYDYKAAVDCFQKAIYFRPSLALAYLNLGTSLIALGRCQEAAAILREGSKLEGVGLRDRTAHNNARISTLVQLGGLYAEQGKLQRALAVYREALHNLPDSYPAQAIYHRLGDTLARLHQWNEAERFHQAALKVQPDHVATHVSYGTMLARNSSRTSEAELWFKRALKLAPSDSSVHHHYAEFLTSVSRQHEACSHRVRAAELSSNEYSLVVSAATALRLLDRKIEAEKWYRLAVTLRPDDARSHTNLGAILHLLGRSQSAAASYQEALRLQPGDPTTLANLAKLGAPTA